MKIYNRKLTTGYCKTLLFVWIFVTTVVEISSKPQRIDCRKHLYAPICRGVAAKRDVPYSYPDDFRFLSSYDIFPPQYPENEAIDLY